MEKSARKSAPGKPFKAEKDARRGKGPKKGAPNAGRPPDEIRATCRLAFDERVPMLESIADNEQCDPMVRMKAMEMLAKYGLGTTWTPTNTAGDNLQLPQVIIA